MADNVTLPGTGSAIATDDVAGVQFQRVKVAYGADGSAADVTDTVPFPVSINAAGFITSTVNSSTTNLAAGATFTGTIESTVNQPSVSYLLTSDQPSTITITQYIDLAGTYPVNNIVRYVEAGAGYSESFPINGDYIKFTATNTGTATTTGFNLNVGFGTIPAADKFGRMPISVQDCIPLLSQTLTTATNSTVIDTAGYSAIVVQLSGMWQGFAIFEGANVSSSTD